MIPRTLILSAFFIAGFPALGETKAVLDIEKTPPPGQTLVWSPLFQDSWDKMNAILGGLPTKIEPANALMSHLDQFQWKVADVMPKGGYATFAGPATPEFARATAAEIKKQFGVKMTPSRLPTDTGGYSIYGILVRDLSFEKAFFRSKKSPLKFKDSEGKKHKVEFFGTIGSYSDNYGQSVKVLDYKPQKQSFILQVSTDREDETLIIFRPEIALSFEKAIQQVTAAIKAPLSGRYGSLTDGTLHKNDTVKIPYLSLDADTFFTSQLKGARFHPKEKQPWRVAMAYQITRFELFEKGARIRVETATGAEPFGTPSKPKKITYVPRYFTCDGPFFVFAWREKAPWPYFAAWIDSKEPLQPFGRQ